jgi:hypothetical protein
MLFIIRKDTRVSLKTDFIVQLLSQNFNKIKVFYVFKKESEKFREKWGYNYVQLPSSIVGLLTYYLLLMIRGPEEFRNALMRRLSLTTYRHVVVASGFLAMLRRTLYLLFGTSARTSKLMDVLNKLGSNKVFLVDEFVSLNCLNLKKLKLLGPIIYVSQDVAYNQYGFRDNIITRKLMFRLEQNAVSSVDLVIACSEMERLKYLEMGAKKAVFYPNIYPIREFEPCQKERMPSISIVLRDHWGFKAEQSLEEIFNALACLNKQIRVCLIGVKPPKVPTNIILEYHKFIPSKLDYLRALSKSWIGINVGIHMAGTNERKYDYAEAGLIVFSDTLGVRGDLLPNEYTYVDSQDLIAKIGQLLEFDEATLTRMGKENRDQALCLAEKERKKMFDNICKIIVDCEC